MKRTLAFGSAENLMVLYHSKEAPSEAEWKRWLEAWFTFSDQMYGRLLVVTEGGTPNPDQRQQLSHWIRAQGPRVAQGRVTRVAVMTDSMFGRVVTNTFAAMERTWLAARWPGASERPPSQDSQIYRAFAREDLRAALTWLELPPSREADVRRVIAALEAELARG
jgi:hypothetical protein